MTRVRRNTREKCRINRQRPALCLTRNKIYARPFLISAAVIPTTLSRITEIELVTMVIEAAAIKAITYTVVAEIEYFYCTLLLSLSETKKFTSGLVCNKKMFIYKFTVPLVTFV